MIPLTVRLNWLIRWAITPQGGLDAVGQRVGVGDLDGSRRTRRRPHPPPRAAAARPISVTIVTSVASNRRRTGRRW